MFSAAQIAELVFQAHCTAPAYVSQSRNTIVKLDTVLRIGRYPFQATKVANLVAGAETPVMPGLSGRSNHGSVEYRRSSGGKCAHGAVGRGVGKCRVGSPGVRGK